jgi:hypothetical protein
MNLPKGTELVTMSVGLTQESDCCADNDLIQTLEVEIADGGGGKYVVIKTDRWAVGGTYEEVDAFCAMLKQILDEAENNQHGKE